MDIKRLLKLFAIFFRIGIYTIGGGLVLIPVIHREFVEKRKWVSDEKMLDIFAVSQALPGVVAVNSSVYVGYELYGLPGAVAAAIGITLPSLICILVIFFALTNIGGNIYLMRFYTGVRAAVVALIGLAAVKLGKSAVKDMFGACVALFGVAATIVFRLDLVYIVLLSGFSGWLYYCVIKRRKGSKNGS